MKRCLVWTLALAALTAGQRFAAAQDRRVPGSQQADVHNPYSPSYLPLLPNQPVRQVQSGGYRHYHHHWGGGYGYSPLFPPVYIRSPWYYPGGIAYGYGYGGYAPLPLVIPADTMFGPAAARRFMGADLPLDAGPIHIRGGNAPANAAGNTANPAPAEHKPKVRVANKEFRARAGKFMDFGDALFAKQKFNQALERYKTAAQTAPDLPATYLRQGFALVAMGQYESAGKVFRRGLAMNADWADSEFRLKKLYGDAKVAKTAHFESLAQAADDNPHDANLLALLGLELYFDGRSDRATAFFQRSAQLGGNEDHALDSFLPPPGPNDKAGAKQPGMVKF